LSQNYQDLVKTIEEIEQNAEKVDFNSIDISSIRDSKTKTRKPPFRPLLELAMKLDMGHSRDAPQVQYQAKAQQQQQAAAQARQRTNENVKKELSALAKKTAKGKEEKQRIGKFNIRANDERDLVLPKLSMQDQISELEGMLKGIRDRAFDFEHIEKVRKEAFGLNKHIIREMMKGAKKKLNKTEQSLIALRDQRLTELMKILSDS
jgi:hypothetical protein